MVSKVSIGKLNCEWIWHDSEGDYWYDQIVIKEKSSHKLMSHFDRVGITWNCMIARRYDFSELMIKVVIDHQMKD